MGMTRRATVSSQQDRGLLHPLYHDTPQARGGPVPGIPVPPPFIGSVFADPVTGLPVVAGLFSQPMPGAQVVTHYVDAVVSFPAATSAAAATPGLMPVQQPGEIGIFAKDGSILSHATASGVAVLYQNAAGTIKLSIDPVTGNLTFTTLAGGHLVINGVTVAVP